MPRTLVEAARSLEDSSARIRSGKGTGGDVAVSRGTAFTNTVLLGGSIAAFVTHYVEIPEQLHAHAVTLIVFAWQSIVALVRWGFQKLTN